MNKRKKVEISKVEISVERKKYLRKLQTQKGLVFFTQIAILVGFVLIWEWLANAKIIDSFITSQPSRIWQTLMDLGSNDLLKHIRVTCFETIIGFLLGTSMGIIIAIILWWSNFLSKVMEPYLVVLNSLPKIALRTSHYYMGRSRNASYYCGCISYFINCNSIRNFKWILKNRS